MQQIFTSTSKVMLDYKGGGNLLYLPLDKLMQQAATPVIDQSGVARQPSPEAPLAPETAPRSREALRERGRGER
jgi:membrane protease subunit HflK